MATSIALGNNIINKPNNRARDMYYNNDSATFNRVYNLMTVKTDWQTLTGTFTDVFWTKTFEEATGRATGKPLGQNQGNPQTASDTAAVCNIIPRTKRTSSALDKAPPLFYLFSSEVKYAQVL